MKRLIAVYCIVVLFITVGCARTLSRISGEEYVITLPATTQQVIWVDFTSGGAFGSTIKNVTFKDVQGEMYTVEIKDYELFQGMIHWLAPGSKESESWTTSRTYTSKYTGGVTNIKLPDDYFNMLSVSVRNNGTKDITYITSKGEIRSQEYKDFSPFEGRIAWTTSGSGDQVEQFFFGRTLSRFTGKTIEIRLPENFSKIVGVDFTEGKNGLVKNVTYKDADGRYWSIENRDKGIFEGGVEWVADGRETVGINTRIFSRLGFTPVKIHLPPDFDNLVSVSIKANGVKDVVYQAKDGSIRAREYRDTGLFEGRILFKPER